MRVYKFLPLEFAAKVIQARSIKVSRFNDLNDPFELYSMGYGDENAQHILAKQKEVINQNWGVVAFSKSWSNLLMWAHYADCHKGVVLELEIDDSLIREVNYSSKRDLINFDGIGHGFFEAYFQKSRTKSEDWHYEEEVRLECKLISCRFEEGLFFRDFGDEISLKGIIVGLACPANSRSIGSLLGSFDFEIKKCAVSNDSFTLSLESLSDKTPGSLIAPDYNERIESIEALRNRFSSLRLNAEIAKEMDILAGAISAGQTAKELLRQAVRVKEALRNATQADHLSYEAIIDAVIYMSCRRFAESSSLFGRALVLLDGSGSENLHLEINREGLMVCLYGGITEQSVTFLNRLMPILDKPDLHDEFARVVHIAGMQYMMQGLLDLSKHCYQQMLALADSIKDDSMAAFSMARLAAVQGLNGSDQAMQIWRQAFDRLPPDALPAVRADVLAQEINILCCSYETDMAMDRLAAWLREFPDMQPSEGMIFKSTE